MANVADLVDEILGYEESLDNFPGPTTKKQAVVIKRFQTRNDYILRLTDDESGSIFNLKCPAWVFEKSRPNTRLEIVYEMVKTGPDGAYKERLLGFKRLSPSGKRSLSWAI